MQNGKDSVILITNDVGNKREKDDESMGALVARLGIYGDCHCSSDCCGCCGSCDCGRRRYGFDQRRRGIKDGTVKENFI